MDRFAAFLESEKQARLIRYSGYLAGLCALFLAIPNPANPTAKTALANIQVFWLVLLTLTLTWLFWEVLKFVRHAEKRVGKKYDFPAFGVFSLSVGAIFLIVLGSFWAYIGSLYSYSLAVLVGTTFPALVVIPCFLVLLTVEKYSHKFTLISAVIIDSGVLTILFSALLWWMDQTTIIGKFTSWNTWLIVGLELSLFTLYLGASLYNKRNIFQPIDK